MKKVFIIVGSILGALLIAFGGVFAYYSGKANQHNQQVAEANAEIENMSDEEKFRTLSKEADFVTINADDYDPLDPYKITGETSFITGTDYGYEFTLTTETKDGYGIYTVTIMTEDVSVSEGDRITAYGTFAEERASDGTPNLLAFVID